MMGKRRWAMLLAAALVTTSIGLSASADAGQNSQFLSLINSTRAANGLGPLSVDGGLASHASKHTAEMIAANDLYHSSSAELAAAGGSGWEKLAENVGRGGSVSSLHDAFMASAGHKKNILGDFNWVGIGTGTAADGRLYVTVVFMKKGAAAPPPTTTTTAPPATTTTAGSSPTTAAKSPTTTVAKAATTTVAPTTTTLPPTTTTTMIVGPDKPVTPGDLCLEATRFWQMCYD